MSYFKLNRTTLATALALALSTPIGAMAQDQAPPEQEPATTTSDKDAQTLDKVVVTGSRIKRAEIEGPAPMFVITGEQIKAEGFSTVYEALETLTEVTGTVEPDVQWGQHTINASPLNLRNMGPGRSLLLINGRRVADYPLPYQGRSNFANYNNIPTGAVDRIEILASGASAIYGSDAVAGVINVILKSNYSGDEVKIRGGTTTRGGADTFDLSWNGGKSGANWNLIYALQAYHRDPLEAMQRPFMDSEQDINPVAWTPEARFLGIAKPIPSVDNRIIDNNTGFRLAPLEGACEQYGDRELFTRYHWNRNTGQQRTSGTQCADAVFKHWTLRNGNDAKSGYLYGTYDFDNGMQAWATLGTWYGEGKSMTFAPSVVVGNSSRDASGNSTDGVWFDPGIRDTFGNLGTYAVSGVHRFSDQEVGGMENGGYSRSKELSWDFHAGLKGTMFSDRFDWDFVIGRAEYRVEENFPSILNNDDVIDSVMGLGPVEGYTSNGVPIRRLDQNRFWYPITPDQYWSMATIGKNRAESWLTQANFTISGDLFEGWAGPIGFAAVVEAAEQGYELSPDPNTLGDNPLYFQTVNSDLGGGDRRRWALGAEFKVPLLKNLTATAAARYDDYDQTVDEGKMTWQAGLEFRPLDSLLFRGTVATSFRAPDMHYVYAQNSSTLIDATDWYFCMTHGDPNECDDTGTVREGDVQDIPGRRQGSPLLQYETGRSWTAGVVWDVMEGLSLSADYWNIELKDGIRDIGREQVLLDEAYCRLGRYPDRGGAPPAYLPGTELCALQMSRVVRGPDPDGAGPELGNILSVEDGPINSSYNEVEGVDAAAHYRLNTDRFGTFGFSLNYTAQLHVYEQTFSSEPIRDRRDDNIRSKLRGSVSWNSGNWHAVLYGDRVSGGKRRWGECERLADGQRVWPDQDCTDLDTASPTFGQQTHLVYERNPARILWNASVGYDITEMARINFFVNNAFDKVYTNPYCADFAFCYGNPVGREVSMEYVLKFN